VLCRQGSVRLQEREVVEKATQTGSLLATDQDVPEMVADLSTGWRRPWMNLQGMSCPRHLGSRRSRARSVAEKWGDHCRCLFNQAVNSLDGSQHLCDLLFSMWCLTSHTSDAGQTTTHHNELLHAPPTLASQQLVVMFCTRDAPQHHRQVSMLTRCPLHSPWETADVSSRSSGLVE
jgi:hypothetical protein